MPVRSWVEIDFHLSIGFLVMALAHCISIRYQELVVSLLLDPEHG